jgi:hypothetical protein
MEALLSEGVKDPGDVATGQRWLADKLRGLTVFLVVDNVSRGQLERLLPRNIMSEVLGEGSMILVASQDDGAVSADFTVARRAATPCPVEAAPCDGTCSVWQLTSLAAEYSVYTMANYIMMKSVFRWYITTLLLQR